MIERHRLLWPKLKTVGRRQFNAPILKYIDVPPAANLTDKFLPDDVAKHFPSQ